MSGYYEEDVFSKKLLWILVMLESGAARKDIIAVIKDNLLKQEELIN